MYIYIIYYLLAVYGNRGSHILPVVPVSDMTCCKSDSCRFLFSSHVLCVFMLIFDSYSVTLSKGFVEDLGSAAGVSYEMFTVQDE